jgi:hypothetical protein
MRQVITCLDTATLIERGSGIVRFGTAPDGLSFLVTAPAPPRAVASVSSCLGVMGKVIRGRAGWSVSADCEALTHTC